MPDENSPPRRGNLLKLQPLVAKTLVDQVVDAIVEATATGVFLPGDRIVEAELARSLNVSRVPVREALRFLESQGIVVNERYRGMRLMDVNIDRLEKILKVRLALENLAGREVIEKLKHDKNLLEPLERLLSDMYVAADNNNGYGVASLDTEFHQCLCSLAGNEILLRTWAPLSQQLTIIFGLSTLKKKLRDIVAEHEDVIETLHKRNIKRFEETMKVHILDYSRAIDYEGLVKQLRAIENRGKLKKNPLPGA